ncbi:MAG: efflux RND transporter periplasmic adaptor subunit [Gammaproteobacteria bacterium]
MDLSAKTRRSIFWLVIAAFIAAGMFIAFKPTSIPVDLATVETGPLVVSVGEEGETRIRDVYTVSAPITGRMLRIEAEVGEKVVAAQTLIAQIEPSDPAFLDLRSEEEARAAVKAAEASMNLAKAQLTEAESEFEFAAIEVERANKLSQAKVMSRREVDSARRDYKSKQAVVNTAKARLVARQHELAQARAHLVSPADLQNSDRECDCVSVLAPVSGTILQILEENEGVVERGTPLVEIGDASDLEIVVDFLSSDAVKIQPGQRVIIDRWGGNGFLQGVVRKIEPFGFTKTSSLGIDEQRVNVIIDISSPHEQWQRLGHGYQVDVEVVLWEGVSVLKVPLTALFRHSADWAIFVNEHGVARLRTVEVGQRNGLAAEIKNGLSLGDEIILHPSNRINDGVRIEARSF